MTVALVAGFIVAMESGVLTVDSPERDAPPPETPGSNDSELTALPGGLVLGNGSEGYDYRPQLAYVDESGLLWLVDADGSGSVQLLDGCGEAITWSADGSTVYCLGDDGSVQANSAAGDRPVELFDADCLHIYPSPDGSRVACQVESGEVTIVDDGGNHAGTLDVNMRPADISWSPTGTHLVYQAPEIHTAIDGSRKSTHRVADANGEGVVFLEDARVGLIGRFAWTLDGAFLAFASDAGLSVLDVPTGDRRIVDLDWIDGAQWGSGPSTTGWVLDDTAMPLDATVWPGDDGPTILVDLTTGDRLPLPDIGRSHPWLAPDGLHAAFAWPRGEGIVEIVNFEAETTTTVEGVEFTYQGEGDGPVFVFAGDSRRLCWHENTGGVQDDPVLCANVDGSGVFEVVPPVTHARRPGLSAPRWREFSPDLTHLAYVEEASRSLHIGTLDGSAAVAIGSILTPSAYAWRTDGVFRPPGR